MPNNHTISVAICTYNGERFLREELDSILAQELLVDEIVVSDDGSQDSTIAIIKEYMAKYTNIRWKLNINQPALRVVENFNKCISMCTGDLIFTADQDDVWNPNKTKEVVRYFDTHPDKDVVFTNATFIDENSHDSYTDKDLFICVGMDRTAQKYFDEGFGLELLQMSPRATGATMCMRKTF